jgi:hypothetical protein
MKQKRLKKEEATCLNKYAPAGIHIMTCQSWLLSIERQFFALSTCKEADITNFFFFC